MEYTYTFDQLRGNPAGIKALFMNHEWMINHGGVDTENYFTADNGVVEARTPQEACEKLFHIYNYDPPACYHGRNMSVSDIVNLWDNTVQPPLKSSWFCDSIGFKEL